MSGMTVKVGWSFACLVGAIAIALSGTAYAGPAGQEYLPSVPKSQGHGGSSSPASSAGTTATSPEAPAFGGGGGKGQGHGKGTAAKTSKPAKTGAAAPASSSSSSDDSSGGFLNPIILLVIAGVVIIAIAMTLARRGGADSDGQEDPAMREAPNAPPTPEGEIVGGGSANDAPVREGAKVGGRGGEKNP